MTMEIKKVKPINGNVIVKDDKKEEVSSGGIIIPDNASPDHIVNGEVVSVSGPWINEKGETQEVRGIKEGNKVLYAFTAGAGNAWEEDGQIYRVVKPVEVLAVVE